MKLSKRDRSILAVITGFALLVALAFLIWPWRPQPAPKPQASPSPAATVSVSPSSKPTLRPPTIIVTPPPTPNSDPSGVGKG